MEGVKIIGRDKVLTIDTNYGGEIKPHESLAIAVEYIRREYPGNHISKVLILVVDTICQLEPITEEEEGE